MKIVSQLRDGYYNLASADDLVKVTNVKIPDVFEVYNSSNGISIILNVGDVILEDINGTNIGINNVKSVKVIRKTGSAPMSDTDGTTIFTVTGTNVESYSSTPFVDTDVTNDTTYYYRAYVTGTNDTSNSTSARMITKTTSDNHIYGFKIKKNESDPATRVIYTDENTSFTPMSVTTSATNYGTWQDTFVINSFRPVALKYDGTVDYELDHDDQTKKLDGTASDISDTSYAGNMMVEVKKMYMYCYEDTEYEYCKIANYPVSAKYKSYAFVNDSGDSVDYIYLPMFKGSNVNSVLRSIAGQAPQSSTTRATEITLAQANGDGWYIRSWSEWVLIQNLLILLGKSTDTQSVFGSGHQSGGSSSAANLLTTGTLKSTGMFYGDPSTSSNVAVKVFWLENWYGDRWDRTAGCIIKHDDDNNTDTIHIKPTRPYNGNDTTGYFDTSIYPTGTNGGYTNKMTMTQYGLVPTQVSGSASTYYTDGMWFSTGERYALTGGHCGDGLGVGALYLYLADSFSHSAWHIGASPSFK